ncbi:hypothetical protein NDU88_006054 [Pleurodeles waltl]|uniref:Uncharacterized protein n=1 Tax=Pleurodeles waltl TaxID=8319 RepID=A0AAV7MZT5_PLEWA|nr:hypothetical protein NDU88_006054 [Pleurodeles waltl]
MTSTRNDQGEILALPGSADDQDGSTAGGPAISQQEPVPLPLPAQTGDTATRANVPGMGPSQVPTSGRSGSERYHLRYNPNPSQLYADFALG